MKYLLDTDVIIDHLRKKKAILEQMLDSATISIITLGELIYGAYKSVHPQKSLLTLREDLETKGERLDDFDLLIAATAIVSRLVLVTRNRKHFEGIPSLQLL